MYLRFLKYAVVESKADFLQRYNLMQEEISSITDTDKINILMTAFIGYLLRFVAIYQIQVRCTGAAAPKASPGEGFASQQQNMTLPLQQNICSR